MCLIVGHIKYPDKDLVYEGLPKGINWWGNNLDRMTKNCMKIRKLAFLCENSRGGGGGGGVQVVLEETLYIEETSKS